MGKVEGSDVARFCDGESRDVGRLEMERVGMWRYERW
jgi:hypothetical protein